MKKKKLLTLGIWESPGEDRYENTDYIERNVSEGGHNGQWEEPFKSASQNQRWVRGNGTWAQPSLGGWETERLPRVMVLQCDCGKISPMLQI